VSDPFDIPDSTGQLMHSLLNPEPSPGPPYTHTFTAPEPIGEDEDGNPLYPEPGPDMTLEYLDSRNSPPFPPERPRNYVAAPYRFEVVQDTGNTRCFPLDGAPP
jgi:hypothetical protein